MTKGQLAQLGAKFLQVLPLDADKDEVQKVIEDENDPMWVAIAKRFTASVATKVLSLKDMIAAGRYDWVNSDITEKRFPMPKDFVLGAEPKVFHFDRDISSEKAIALMDADGYRPATIFDLLDYGAKNPEEQRKYPILALGSVALIYGDRCVAFLHRDDSERHLDLFWFDFGWSAFCRFLAVRK